MTKAPSMGDDKTREVNLRRAARRQGLVLEKSRRRDPRAIGFGTWRLLDERTRTQRFPLDGPGVKTLDEIDAYLNR